MEKKNKKGWWGNKTTKQKIYFIIAVILAIISIFLLIVFLDLRRFVNEEIADKVYGEGVSTGWAAIGYAMANSVGSWIITAIIIFVTFIFIFVSNFITHLFDNGSRKSKTISSLIRSLIKYVAIIAAICFILTAWGVDVVGIVAGVGVLTLIIGLGCQSLIQDVVSGLFIVFDDYFSAGDTVIIDGFRGTVVDVGLKTTKLQDFGGNIKSITNSSILTVVNMSRLRSVVSVTLSVSYNEDVERIEALIINEIEEIKKKIPNIIEGPWYKGIDSVGASSINFLVIAFTKEDNRFQVTRDLNREFYLCFKKNNVQIPFNQITVNPQDDKNVASATNEQKIIALNEQKKLRGVTEEKEKAKISKRQNMKNKVKESLDKTRKDIEEL